jgi:hypothetical protein
MLHYQPANVLAPAHPAPGGHLVHRFLQLDGSREREAHGFTDLAGMMFGLTCRLGWHKKLLSNISLRPKNAKHKMKKAQTGIRTTKSFSITVPIELEPVIKEAARAQGRNVSSFLVWLVRKDTQEKITFS